MSDSYTRTSDYEELPSSAGEDHPPVLTLEFGTDNVDSDELETLSRTTASLAQMLRDETVKFERENAVIN